MAVGCMGVSWAQGVGNYEGRTVTGVDVVIEGSAPDAAAEGSLRSLLAIAPNSEYHAVLARRSLEALFNSGLVSNARVEVVEAGNAVVPSAPGAHTSVGLPVRVRFVVRRQARVSRVVFELGTLPPGTPISQDEIRARLNMMEPGSRLSEQVIRRNADEIQVYLRDRGFFRATVEYSIQTDTADPTGTRSIVTYRINTGEQAHVENFSIKINGFSDATVRPALKLQQNAPFTRAALGEDLNKIRQAIIALGNLAPQLDDPKVTLNDAGNAVVIDLTGGIGPKVDVEVRNYEVSPKTQRALLPVRREGNIDYSAIEEGRRRLRNKLQAEGYFFAEINYTCTVSPPLPTTIAQNGTEETCQNLNATELSGHNVQIVYDVDPGRRFKLTDIRIEGTSELTYLDVADDLKTQKASALGIIPYLGYGRGYTSLELLEQDRRTISARMRDLGYRRATVNIRRGVALTGDNLIITFDVTPGPITRVAGVEFRGNQIYTEPQLREEINSEQCLNRLRLRNTNSLTINQQDTRPIFKTVIGAPFSPTGARVEGDCILDLYARNGYVDANVDFSIVELPKKSLPDNQQEEQVRLIYTITSEGDKVYINSIRINGLVRTHQEEILRMLPLRTGDVLRADRLNESERILYATDAFRQVIIHTENAGETVGGFKQRDIIIDVEERKPRVMTYGGGYSTDTGPLGIFEIRDVNLFGKLRQGAMRLRASGRTQLLRFEYLDPRFRSYATNQFAPLSLSLEYERDTTVTRFFRSTIDRGNFGIVQRLDPQGRPIDVNCANENDPNCRAGEPTINRLVFTAETQRVLSDATHSIVFARYSYEDVRLFNINSLLLAPVLRPDRVVRLSRFGASFVRDTRDNQFDASRGDFLTLDYAIALRQLGGNISFSKFQASYRRYYRLNSFRRTTLAGSLTLGLANLFNPRDRDADGIIDEADNTLPISERFFSGGSTTLRGFGYQEAGPRAVIPGGIFRTRQGNLITLNPFTVPVGGNALVVLNLEARVPVTSSLQAVPFYDGGNVFRRVGDIFGRARTEPEDSPNLHAHWTHTVGMGFRVKVPFGGSIAIDYGLLLNPPEFQVPQANNTTTTFILKNSQLHFRFTQAF